MVVAREKILFDPFSITFSITFSKSAETRDSFHDLNVTLAPSSFIPHARLFQRISPKYIFSMHRCLLVPEILQNILNSHQKHNGAEYQRILTAHNLLAATLSCKWFAEPALDLIWKHVPDLRYLLKCLPAGLWEETVDNDHKTFVRAIIPTAFDLCRTMFALLSYSASPGFSTALTGRESTSTPVG